MKKHRRQLAWGLIAVMLACNSATAYADVSAFQVPAERQISADKSGSGGKQEEVSENSSLLNGQKTGMSTASDADNSSDDVRHATASDADQDETYFISYRVTPEDGAEVKGKEEVRHGKNLKFSVKPQDGYEIEAVTANGTPIEGDRSLLGLGKTRNYLVRNVRENQMIEIDLQEIEAERPAFAFEQTMGDVTISLTADKGVLPEGTTAKVKAVSASKAKKLAKEADSEGELQDVIAYDIKLYDADGNELDDSWAENGAVKVSFSGEKIEKKQELADRVEIQHYDADDRNPEVKEITADEELSIEAEHFSVFAIGFYAVRESSPSEIYVCATNSDAEKDTRKDTGDGTEDNPYASLAKAFEAASGDEETTIYVMSDLMMYVSARSWNKHIVVKGIDGEQYTVTRGDIHTVQDNARSTYNPAMFEANGTSADSASLRFENIILDDNGTRVGDYFIQAQGVGSTEFGTNEKKTSISNTAILQDAIIATYNGVATITLGDGAVLRNFGGMSAVRISGGKLIMENGSVIEDTTVTDRIKGEKIVIEGVADEKVPSYGPAGAVWLQGGELEMEEGSEISSIVGRAIYADGGKVTVNGNISVQGVQTR